MPIANRVDPCDFVIFGGTGDLAVRKLLPALYLRDRDGQLPADTRIIAVSRAGLDDAGYRDKIRASWAGSSPPRLLDDDTVDRFLARLQYVSIDLPSASDWRAVDRPAGGRPRRASGCSTWPAPRACSVRSASTWPARSGHDVVAGGAGEADRPRPGVRAGDQRRRRRGLRGVARSSGSTTTWARRACRTCSSPGSPTRFLEPLWNSSWIDHVQITAAGVARRRHPRRLLRQVRRAARHGAEPPAAGALPGRDGAADLRRPRDRARREAQGAAGPQADVGQRTSNATRSPASTAAGLVDGAVVPRLHRTTRKTLTARTETFVAVKAEVSNWRWAGVPFYLRTGKRMARRSSEIVSSFKPVPHPMFPGSDGAPSPTGWSSRCSRTRTCACT